MCFDLVQSSFIIPQIFYPNALCFCNIAVVPVVIIAVVAAVVTVAVALTVVIIVALVRAV